MVFRVNKFGDNRCRKYVDFCVKIIFYIFFVILVGIKIWNNNVYCE